MTKTIKPLTSNSKGLSRTPGKSLKSIQPATSIIEEFPKCMRSPLRYPGGKSRAVGIIRSLLPRGLSELCSPFLGGGSIELACASDGIRVFAADAFPPLINFWHIAKKFRKDLVQMVRKYLRSFSREQFYDLQKKYTRLRHPIEKAAAFYVLNRSSFSGTTFSGGMSKGYPRFTESAIGQLSSFRDDNLFVEENGYKETLKKYTDMFLYLDPPYANGGRLYGNKGDMHTDFNHEELASILKKRKKWLLSYNDSKTITELYKGYEILRPEWKYGMSSKRSNEILIRNV